MTYARHAEELRTGLPDPVSLTGTQKTLFKTEVKIFFDIISTNVYVTHLKGRAIFHYWVTPQMLTTTGAGSSWNHEFQTPFQSLSWMAGVRYMNYHLLSHRKLVNRKLGKLQYISD